MRVEAAPAVVDDEPLARNRAVRRAVLRRVDAYEVIRRPHAFYTGRTAVAVYDRLFDDDPGEHPLDVGVFAPARAPRVAGVRGIQITPSLASVREVECIPVASPASTWAGLAGELSVRALVRLGDAFVRIPREENGRALPALQLATIEHLRAAASAPRRRDRRKLERALELIRVGSMSPLETDFRLDAGAGGLPEPMLDVEIRDEVGALLGIADVVYPEQRVIVEVEGQQHRTSDRQWHRDIEKYAAFVAAGWEVIRVTSRHIRSGRAVEMVASALRRHGWAG